VQRLYKARKEVEFVDVPDLAFLAVSGHGAPDGPAFADAVQALFTVSYGAHFLLKKERGEAPKVMPLEALWWMDDPEQWDMLTAVARGKATMADTNRDLWRWRALMMQPAPIDETLVQRAVEQGRKKELRALDQLRFERWEEGRCAQVLHVGPYAEEAPTIVRLHQAIAAAGCRPRGHHHEIYIGDPRRSAPEKLRTILRHPVEPL
jgi:hypothetical protein